MSDGLCKPLLVKELRETLRWSPIGMIVIGLLCWQTIPDSIQLYRSLAAQFVYVVGIGAALVALAIGLLQSLGDTRTDARGFLLHRPVSLRSIFTTKLFAGFVAYVLCLAPPLILTAIRLDGLGPQQLPVGSFDLLPLVIASLVIFLLHPAAMWTAYRSARWVGTRTLPLVFAGVGIALAIVLLLESSGWWLMASFPLVVAIWYVVTVQAAWHALAHQTFLPPVASDESMSASRAVGLFVACVVLFTTIAVFPAETLFPRSQQSLVTYDLAVRSNGELWELQNIYRDGVLVVGQEAEKRGRRLTIDQPSKDRFQPLPRDWRPAHAESFNHYSTRHWYDRFSYLGQVVVSNASHGYWTMILHEGRVLVYVQQKGVVQTITPDGIFDSDQNPSGRFRGVTLLSNTTNSANVHLQLERNPLLISSDGVYQVDFKGRKINRLIDAKVGSAAINLPEARGDDASLWVITNDRLSRYRVTSSVADEPLDSAVDPIIAKTQRYPIPLLTAEQSSDFAFGPIERPLFATVAPIDESKIIVTHRINAFRFHIDVLGNERGQPQSGMVRIKPGSQMQEIGTELYCIPPGVIGLVTASTYFLGDRADWEDRQDAAPMMSRKVIVPLLLHSVSAAVLAFWISGRRGVSRKTQVLWAVVAAVFGVMALPAIIAIHPRLVYEACSQCAKPRRIDTGVCEGCGADWDSLPRDGNEVISGWKVESVARVEHSA